MARWQWRRHMKSFVFTELHACNTDPQLSLVTAPAKSQLRARRVVHTQPARRGAGAAPRRSPSNALGGVGRPLRGNLIPSAVIVSHRFSSSVWVCPRAPTRPRARACVGPRVCRCVCDWRCVGACAPASSAAAAFASGERRREGRMRPSPRPSPVRQRPGQACIRECREAAFGTPQHAPLPLRALAAGKAPGPAGPSRLQDRVYARVGGWRRARRRARPAVAARRRPRRCGPDEGAQMGREQPGRAWPGTPRPVLPGGRPRQRARQEARFEGRACVRAPRHRLRVCACAEVSRLRLRLCRRTCACVPWLPPVPVRVCPRLRRSATVSPFLRRGRARARPA